MWGFRPDDVHLLAAPGYHAGPLGYAVTTLLAGVFSCRCCRNGVLTPMRLPTHRSSSRVTTDLPDTTRTSFAFSRCPRRRARPYDLTRPCGS